MHFLIADAIPRAVEGKCGARDFFEAEHVAVKVFRAREIADRDRDVMKRLQVPACFISAISSDRTHHLFRLRPQIMLP